MAFLTTNPSPFLINVPEFQNVVNSATGASGFSSLSNSVNDLLTLINTANSQLNINTIGSSTAGAITFTSNVNLSNSLITFLGSNLLGSNTLNGPTGFIAFQVSGAEQARLTPTGLGLGTTTPSAKLSVNGSAYIASNVGIGITTPELPLDVQGGAMIRGPLYVSTFGTASSATGNIFASGSIYANGSAYITSTLGIGMTTPELPLDVQGGAIIRGPLYVSSFGALSSATGNIIASGDIFANGFFYPSDSRLKRDITAYETLRLPTPIEFTWRGTGERDIGVLAEDVLEIEPACVTRSPAGFLTVDYAKLSVLLLAEVRILKAQMSTVMARMP